jgi:hypothetical protein
MSAAKLMEELRVQGVGVRLDGGLVKVIAPQGGYRRSGVHPAAVQG